MSSITSFSQRKPLTRNNRSCCGNAVNLAYSNVDFLGGPPDSLKWKEMGGVGRLRGGQQKDEGSGGRRERSKDGNGEGKTHSPTS